MSRSRGYNDATRTSRRPPTGCAGLADPATHLMTQKVLVVDDDAAILEVLTMRLGAMGFDVTPVGEPRRALEVAAAQRFDLALIDLRMGPMDGVELMEALHSQQRRLPVLIMTAHGTIDTAVQAVRRGAFDYLTKPFVRDELRAKIERALATRRWARDRERLLTVGQTLASSGIMERVLDAVAQATVEATEAERCVVFQLERGRLVPMASAGSPPPSWEALEAAAAAAMDKGVPITRPAGSDTEAGTIVAAPLVVQRGPTGALVIETPTRVEPTEDDLELLALFSSQAAIAVRNTHELERLRSGALAALGRMATQVAHEIKNPLAGLRLYARHLEQRLGRAADTEGQELAAKIAAGVDHLADVVTEITAFGRPPELHREPTNIPRLLDECLELAAARFDATAVEVGREWDSACPDALMLDARELRKAFLNLIVNAFEALGGSGRLTVSTSYAADAGTLTVVVEDTGTGMSEETISRAFDLFYTTKPDGTGLGMSIARSVVQLHGGELSVQSRLGQGTRVQVRLPVMAP
jgi:two-component system, NtrC family, sensor kinase